MSYEKYYPGGWKSGETGGTPITPEALNHMEKGIEEANENLLPDPQAADNTIFLRNDNTWQKVTPTNIGAVPTSRTVNGKALSGNIALSAADVGARPSSWMPTAADVGAKPSVYEYPGTNGGDLNSYTTETHRFVYNMNNAPSGASHALFDVWRADGGGYSPNGAKDIILQRLISVDNYKITAWRTSRDAGSTWTAWAYDNPSMTIGSEHATTETYKNKSVFVKAVSLDLSTGTGNKYVNIGTMSEVVSIEAYLKDGISSIDIAYAGLVSCYVNTQSGNFFVNSSQVNKTVYAIIKYVK